MAELVHSPGKEQAANLWQLTQTGRARIRNALNLPEVQTVLHAEAQAIQQAAGLAKNPDIASFLEEAAKCVEVGALRAAIVFAWIGGVRVIQERMISKGEANVQAALKKHDPKGRSVKSIDDFAYYKESTQLLAAQELGVLDKSQRETLENCLKERNKCGHPGKYEPGKKKAAAVLEDLLQVAFGISV